MNKRYRTKSRIKTGTYTGDGTEGQTITGVGFRPKYVEIVCSPSDGTETGFTYTKLDQGWGDFCHIHIANNHSDVANAINSLDADGFTVDDAGSDADPNTNSAIYDYIAFG